MASKEFEIAKGVKDYYGKEALLRNHVKSCLQKVFERYGFAPLETPIIERRETLAFKGGGDIQKEVFQLKDQGGRDLALRFDHTVPLARFIGSHLEIKFPFKRYVIGDVFRDGPTQPDQGRYRIFGQCDVDTIGVKDMTAEAELLALACDAFQELGMGDVEIRVNNRKLLDGLLDHAGISESLRTTVIQTLDKLDKIGRQGVMKELAAILEPGRKKAGFSEKDITSLMCLLECEENNDLTLKKLQPQIESEGGKAGLAEVRQLLDYGKAMQLPSIRLDPSLARGLDYYTGTTFEVFLTDRKIVKSAVTGGGRYDRMIGDFRGSGQDIPAVGISFGLERICMVLQELGTVPAGTTDLYIVPIDRTAQCLPIAHALRTKGVCLDMDLQGKRVGQGITYAEAMGIPFVGLIGETELANGVLTVRNLAERTQTEVRIEDIPAFLKKKRLQ